MDAEKRIELDGVSYLMTPCNALASWNALKNALKLLEQVNFSGTSTEKIAASSIACVLANLGDPNIKAIEDLILKHTSAATDGKTYRLSDQFDRHFNQYRGHLLPILKEGLVYQFADFFTAGGGLLHNILPQLQPNNP